MKKFSDFLSKTAPIYSVLQWGFVAAYLFYTIIPYPVMVGFYIATPLINLFLFIFYKDYMENERMTLIALKSSIVLFMLSLPCYFAKLLSVKLNTSIPIPVYLIFGVCFLMLGFAIVVAAGDKLKEKIDEIKVKETLTAKDRDDATNHDIVICKNKETNRDVIWKAKDRYLHSFILGPTGCGKTSQIFIPLILQDIKKGHGVIVMEPKGDLAVKVYAMGKKYNQDVIYFNPVDLDCPYFNPLDGKEDEVIETLTTTFNMLSPDSKTYFQDISNNLLRKSIMVLKRIEAAYTTDWNTGISSRPATLLALSDLIHNTGNKGRDMVNTLAKIPGATDAETKQNRDTQQWFLNEYFSDRSKMYENTSGIRTQVANLIQNKYLRRVLNPEDGKSQLNFDEILAQGKRIAICTAQGDLRQLGKYLGYFLIFSIQSAIFRRPGNENTRIPCYLYMDEFQVYSNDGFSEVLQQGRSYRVSANLATQSRDSVTMHLGPNGKAFLSVISANTRNVIIFPGIAPEDAKYYSEMFGEETQLIKQKGETRAKFELGHGFATPNYPSEQIRYTEQEKARYSTTDITEKKFSEITYRLIVDSSVTPPANGIASWIPSDVNKELDQIADNYIETETKKRVELEIAEEKAKRRIYSDFLAKETGGRRVADGDGSGIKIDEEGTTVPEVETEEESEKREKATLGGDGSGSGITIEE